MKLPIMKSKGQWKKGKKAKEQRYKNKKSGPSEIAEAANIENGTNDYTMVVDSGGIV